MSPGEVDPVEDPATEAWERFAAEDPLFHIEANRKRRESLEAFMEIGRATAEHAVELIGTRAGRGRLLEIGCGLGRTLAAFAEHFNQVDGVDVSPTVLRRAEEIGLPVNVRLVLGSGRDLAPFADTSYDVVFSHLVFQHLPDEARVASYLRETGRVLRPGGAALLHFDTRPRRLAAELVKALPDSLLPRMRRRNMRRYRRDPERVRQWLRDAGLHVEQELGSAADHWFLARS